MKRALPVDSAGPAPALSRPSPGSPPTRRGDSGAATPPPFLPSRVRSSNRGLPPPPPPPPPAPSRTAPARRGASLSPWATAIEAKPLALRPAPRRAGLTRQKWEDDPSPSAPIHRSPRAFCRLAAGAVGSCIREVDRRRRRSPNRRDHTAAGLPCLEVIRGPWRPEWGVCVEKGRAARSALFERRPIQRRALDPRSVSIAGPATCRRPPSVSPHRPTAFSDPGFTQRFSSTKAPEGVRVKPRVGRPLVAKTGPR